jgi:hypothetical protein
MDGGPVEQANTIATYGIWPEWKSDGERIYFAVNDRQSDISMVELIER